MASTGPSRLPFEDRFQSLTLGNTSEIVDFLKSYSMSDPNELPDSTLIDRIGDGDKQALQEVYRRYGKFVYSVAMKLLQNVEEAEEATQDAFLILWEKVETLGQNSAKLLPWLLRIVRNRSIDRLRKTNRRLPSANAILDDAVEKPSLEPAEKETALDELVTKERAEAVKQAIESLPEDQKIAIQLAYFKGFTQSQIAQDLGESLGTIKSRIRYAITRLRKELEKSHVA